MFDFLKGYIVDKQIDHITLLVNEIGYLIYINPTNLDINTLTTIYIYEHKTEKEYQLYGFLNKAQRNFFKILIKIKGIGIKLATNIINYDDFNNIIINITNHNENYFLKIPGISKRLANNIINAFENLNHEYNDIYTILLSLNIKKSVIDNYLKNTNYQAFSIEENINNILKQNKK